MCGGWKKRDPKSQTKRKTSMTNEEEKQGDGVGYQWSQSIMVWVGREKLQKCVMCYKQLSHGKSEGADQGLEGSGWAGKGCRGKCLSLET